MTGIDTLLPVEKVQASEDDLRLTHYEGLREEYERRRDYWQSLMDKTDEMILEIQKKQA